MHLTQHMIVVMHVVKAVTVKPAVANNCLLIKKRFLNHCQHFPEQWKKTRGTYFANCERRFHQKQALSALFLVVLSYQQNLIRK